MKAFELIQRKFGRRNKEYAILGDFDGKVLVPRYKTLNYARVHGVVQLVWNRICDPKPGIEVEIEYQGTQIVVVGLRGRAYPTTDELPLNQAHADSHLEGGKDPVYIWMSQILNFRIVPNGFTVKIWQGRHYGGTWHAPARSSAWNLASYQPVSGAVWVLIYVDRDGTFAAIEGETADSVSLLVPSLIPPLPFGAWAIAAVRLYSAQTAIDGIKDIYDLRWAAMPYNAASGSIEATIASGAITAYSHYIRVYGEGDAADDLATINGGAHGSWVILLAPDGGTAPVTVKNGTGNIVLPADFVLGGVSTALALFYDDEQDKWLPFGTGVSASSVTYSVVTKTANYTITDADDYVLCDATSGNITITMPAAGGRTGRLFTIKKIDTSANTVIITGIYTLTVENQAITLLSTGAVWLATSDRYEVSYPTLVINDAGAAAGDFRAESDTEENMILLDASADALYLGGTTNGVKIDKGGVVSLLGTGSLPIPAGVVKADGSVALTADWDAGSFEIRAQTFESDVATGTPPFVVASTTKVDNLHVARASLADTVTTNHSITISGDVSGTGDNAIIVYIGAQKVTFDKIVHLNANTILGRYTSGISGPVEEISCTAAGRALLDDADAAAQRTTLGLVAAGAGDIWVEKAGDTMTGALLVKPTVDTTTAFQVHDTDANIVLKVDTVNNRVGIGGTASYTLDVYGIVYGRDNALFGYIAGSSGGFLMTKSATYGIPSLQAVDQSYAGEDLMINPAGGNVAFGNDTAPSEKIDVTGNANVTGVYKVDGVQVVGNRVIDDRCDDTVDATWGTAEAGVLDALRDAMIAHGLIAAA